MKSLLYVSPDEGSTGSGGKGGDPNDPKRALLTQGFISLAFGVALGFALVVFQWISTKIGSVSPILTTWMSSINWWEVFLFGLVVGTVTACVYNLLVARKDFHSLSSGRRSASESMLERDKALCSLV